MYQMQGKLIHELRLDVPGTSYLILLHSPPLGMGGAYLYETQEGWQAELDRLRESQIDAFGDIFVSPADLQYPLTLRIPLKQPMTTDDVWVLMFDDPNQTPQVFRWEHQAMEAYTRQAVANVSVRLFRQMAAHCPRTNEESLAKTGHWHSFIPQSRPMPNPVAEDAVIDQLTQEWQEGIRTFYEKRQRVPNEHLREKYPFLQPAWPFRKT